MKDGERRDTDRERARANIRTALVLASIALAFFIGIMIKYAYFA